MKRKILDMLKTEDGYISGEKMSERLKVSRAAVWKYIKALKGDGYVIEAVTNKGYRLVGSGDIINEYEIKSGLKTDFVGQNVHFVYETDSTNNEAKRNFSECDGTVFITEIQNGGKGRLGKGWISHEGDEILMSLLLKPQIAPSAASQITIVAGMAVCRALKEYGAQIKWPNDIVIDGKKICGILTEMSAEIERVSYVVCGVGINVNTPDFPEELSQKATSLYKATGQRFNRCEIIRCVLEAFEELYTTYISEGLSPLIGEYKASCVNIGRHAEAVFANGDKLSGTAVDVTDTGELVIRTENGDTAVFSGEVSVSGIYGQI